SCCNSKSGMIRKKWKKIDLESKDVGMGCDSQIKNRTMTSSYSPIAILGVKDGETMGVEERDKLVGFRRWFDIVTQLGMTSVEISKKNSWKMETESTFNCCKQLN